MNLSLFGMCVVDSWLVYSKCTETEEKQWELYKLLAEEMIENMHDQVHGHQPLETYKVESPELITANKHMQSGISATTYPQKRKGRQGQEALLSTCNRDVVKYAE